jgi:hypothetical protein
MREEPMTGWDSPEDLESGLVNPEEHPGKVLLRALHTYITDPNPPENLDNLLKIMNAINWDAVGFALEAINKGEDLYSAHPGQDVLLRFNQPRKINP